MKQRKVIEIAIFPKIFNVLSFYSKGQYAISISVKQQYSDGRAVPAYPTMVTRNDINITEAKKPMVKVEENEAEFVSEQFYVTYNEETVIMNTMAIFKLEIDPDARSSFFIDFKLVLNKMKKNKGGQQKTEVKRILKVVDTRRIYIKQIMELNHYKRIIFSEYVYLGSAYLGTRFRIQDEQLHDFSKLEGKQVANRQSLCLIRKLALTDTQRGEMIGRLSGLAVSEMKSKMGDETHNSYMRLKERMRNLTKLIEQQTSSVLTEQSIKSILSNEISYDTILKKKEELMKNYEVETVQLLYLEIYREIAEHDVYNRHVWNRFLNVLQKIPMRVFSILLHRYLIKENSLKEINMVTHGEISSSSRLEKHGSFLKRRKQIINEMIICEDDDIYHPFFMVQGFEHGKQVPLAPSLEINSLVVFIHGYQGSDYDLEKAKNFMSIYATNSHALLIKTLQDDIDENLQHLGAKLAGQIRTHIAGTFNTYKKINLVGYSLGGVIARESLKYLEQFKDKMNLLITFASPHLGVTRPDNSLVGTGIWYLINIEKVKNLKQLNCEKNDNQEITLQKLSECQGLGWFKKVILVSSKEDNFVPHYSSRIHPENNDEKLQQMAENILNRINKVERIELWFDVEHNIGTFDKMLGRRAHIEFLENRIFLDMFFRLYSPQL